MIFQHSIKAAGIILLALVAQIGSAQKVITGTVKDSKDGSPLRGASITAKGSRNGTQTNADGTFKLTVDNATTALVVSSVGFTSQEISLSGNNSIEVMLVVNNTSLGEVVIIGYGTARRKDLTGSIATIGKPLRFMTSISFVISAPG